MVNRELNTLVIPAKFMTLPLYLAPPALNSFPLSIQSSVNSDLISWGRYFAIYAWFLFEASIQAFICAAVSRFNIFRKSSKLLHLSSCFFMVFSNTARRLTPASIEPTLDMPPNISSVQPPKANS